MNDTCGCSFSNEEIKDLSLLQKNVLVERGIEMIVVLPKRNLVEIVKIAALLPSPDEMKVILIENGKELSLGITKPFENLHNAVEAIRIALSQMIRGGLYKYQTDIIEKLSIVIDKHSTEKREFWEEELMKALLKDEQLKKVKTWFDHCKSIKKLTHSFNLPEEKIKEILEEAVKEDEKLKNIAFWIDHSSKIRKLVEAFNLSEERIKEMLKELIDKRNQELIRVSNLFIEASTSSEEKLKKEAKDVFDKLIHNDGKMFLSRHLTIAEKMDVLIIPEEYQAITDNLLIAANASTDGWTRKEMVEIAYYTYLDLRKYNLENREEIVKAYKNDKDKYGYERINKIIRMASKVIKDENFKYKKQGFWDIGW